MMKHWGSAYEEENCFTSLTLGFNNSPEVRFCKKIYLEVNAMVLMLIIRQNPVLTSYLGDAWGDEVFGQAIDYDCD